MRTKSLSILVLSILVFITGCTVSKLEENKQEGATVKADSIEDIKALKIEGLENLPKEMIPFSIDPKDEHRIYCMMYKDRLKDNRVLMGGYYRKVGVYEIDTQRGTQKELISETDFITLAKWSYDGKYLGMVGGETLFVYNQEKDEIDNVNQLVNTPSVVYFGWSPHSKTIYTEHPNLPNDSIYDVEEKAGTPRYKVQERKPYFKDSYQKDQYIGTTEIADIWGNPKPLTALLDSEGNVLQTLGEGRYRAQFQGQMLQIGSEHFGLTYFVDAEKQEGKGYSGEYIYQAAFTPQGDVVYTTKGDLVSTVASYKLHLLRKRKLLKTYEVSGPYFAIWPNGKYIDVGGYGEERIDLEQKEKFRKKLVHLVEGSEEINVMNTLIGAVDLDTKLYFRRIKEDEIEEKLSQYYVNSHEPVRQWALLDRLEEAKAWINSSPQGTNYHITGELGSMEIEGDRASVTAGFSFRDSGGSGWSFGCAYELIRQEGKWYITGLSTFPQSKERQQVEKGAKSFINNTMKGGKNPFSQEASREIYEKIKGKNIGLGQIQFWAMSEPHLAPAIERANYAKVYLEVEGELYKLVLTKKGSINWRVESLSENLLGLF